MVAHRFDDGLRLGWEAGGGWAVAHANAGQSFGLREGSQEAISYIAAEPGILVGASVGLAHGAVAGAGLMSGAWLGAPIPVEMFSSEDEVSEIWGMDPALSLAIGYRFAHGHEIYLTPKFYLIKNERLAH